MKRKPKPKPQESFQRKPGTRPISIFSNTHPARMYGWHSPEAVNRDKRKFQ